MHTLKLDVGWNVIVKLSHAKLLGFVFRLQEPAYLHIDKQGKALANFFPHPYFHCTSSSLYSLCSSLFL